MKAINLITGELVELEEGQHFFTQFLRPTKDESERLPTKTNVERAYIPPEDQIREMMASGERLAAARRARYALPGEETDEELVVGGGLGSDLVDAGRVRMDLIRADEAARAAAVEAARKEQEAAFEARVAEELEKRRQAAEQPKTP